jgi:hypothetical protein
MKPAGWPVKIKMSQAAGEGNLQPLLPLLLETNHSSFC